MTDPRNDHFALFGLPPRFAIDEASLDQAYRRVQAQVHPDRFAAAGAAERRVALEVRKGLSTRALAARLGLSPRTVEAHRLSLRRKLGLARRGGNLRSRLLTLMGPSAEAPDDRGGGQPAS